MSSITNMKTINITKSVITLIDRSQFAPGVRKQIPRNPVSIARQQQQKKAQFLPARSARQIILTRIVIGPRLP